MLDGRVKTLHPKIHSGIFSIDQKNHKLQMKNYNFEAIDLVIVNFYPFQQALKIILILKM